jgi:hypothetical protein
MRQKNETKEETSSRGRSILLTDLLQWLQATSLAVFIHDHRWAFTTLTVVHVFSIAMMVATITIVDLRLLGLVQMKRPFTELAGQVLPATWVAFVVAAIAGSLIFISQATDHFENTAFRIKILLIVAAGINMLIFELITVKGAPGWDLKIPPPSAKLAGGISIACWALVIVFGRWTGFTMPTQ